MILNHSKAIRSVISLLCIFGDKSIETSMQETVPFESQLHHWVKGSAN